MWMSPGQKPGVAGPDDVCPRVERPTGHEDCSPSLAGKGLALRCWTRDNIS